MIHGRFVAATEAFAVVCLGAVGNMGMAVLIAIVDVGPAMVVVVLAGAFDTVVVSLPLDIAKLLWRCVPIAIMVTVMVLNCFCR